LLRGPFLSKYLDILPAKRLLAGSFCNCGDGAVLLLRTMH
jgi:hypothetical protein